MRIFSYILWAILIVVGASFAILNSQSVPLNYFVDKTTIYFPLLFLLLLIVGVFFGVLVLLPFYIRGKAQIHCLKHKIKSLEQEVIALRTVSAKNES